MKGKIIANASAADRNSTDFYPTPENVTQALLEWWQLDKSTKIWEPACGEGHMSKTIEKDGYEVYSSTLLDQGYGNTGIDFLETTELMGGAIITNPPFKYAVEFIEKCLSYNVPFAFLLKSQFWHASGRMEIFNRHTPKAILPLTWRPDFHFGTKSGSPTMECAWTVWDKNPSNGAIYHPLKRPANRPVDDDFFTFSNP